MSRVNNLLRLKLAEVRGLTIRQLADKLSYALNVYNRVKQLTPVKNGEVGERLKPAVC
jgi:hypothetical protein